MGDKVPRTTRDPLAESKCPACGLPRDKMVTRHKVLGAWVPEWEVQPCHNPDCSLYESAQAHTGGSQDPGVAAATGTQVTGKNGEIGRSPATG
ncbi:hypothetical protein [Streptomyces gardneri]|uniref:Uncharacterized protein n=1 Tax=Streptomyces gardneri TaxID=66892 RepID=A0A4Y3RQE0_9ACTN|nr:hypothetical protein [Streptomyces gardneri]GEB59906.1 hypothetical protein SGA01_55110 [Streptomyces gardneri]GHG85976.1 hypothetical protein GCM10017674_10380 [Streptomyces gardneri]